MKRALLAALAVSVLASILSCSRQSGIAPGDAAPPSIAPSPATEIEDTRLGYESRGYLQGEPLSLEGAFVAALLPGRPLAGPYLLGGGEGSLLVAAMAAGRGAELVAFAPDGELRAATALTGRPLDAVASGARIVVAPEAGGLACYGMGQVPPSAAFVPVWKNDGPPAERLLLLPEGRIAAANDDGSLACLYIESGEAVWTVELGYIPFDLAYVASLVLACGEAGVEARSEKDGSPVWKSRAAGDAALLAAGEGRIASLDAEGRLAMLDAADGRLLAKAEGPFDPRIRPAMDLGGVFAALPGGGAVRLDARTGEIIRSWSWPRPSAFLALDEGKLYASSGSSLVLRDRYGEDGDVGILLPSTAAGSALRVEGGFLAIPCSVGIAVLGLHALSLEASSFPSGEAVKAIEEALAGLGGEESAGRSIRFVDFVSGAPVYPADGLLVLRYVAPASGKRTIEAVPDPGNAVLAVFDEEGRKLADNVDELGSPGRLSLAFAAGHAYWIAAGGWAESPDARYRLILRQ